MNCHTIRICSEENPHEFHKYVRDYTKANDLVCFVALKIYEAVKIL
jgi:hypothetical protein